MRIFEEANNKLNRIGFVKSVIHYHYSGKQDVEIHKNIKSFTESYDYCMRSQDAEFILID
tara:strand:- start:240 stop:419 length:180 start_codon:yes stop_codon:yes gene_type:complete